MEHTKLEALLKDMSLAEKIGQLVQLHGVYFSDDFEAYTGPEAQLDIPEPCLAGSVLGECGAEKLRYIQDKIMAGQPHHIPAMFMADVIHGYRTAFPVPIALGSSFNPSLAEAAASAAAKECSAAGVHVTFSPMVDLARDSRWGRCMESTGEDPWLNSRMAESMVRGFQGSDLGMEGKVASCAKHFAAYGAVQAGRDYNITEISEHTLREDYLPSYKAAADAGVSMIMTAFNTISRIPCTVNKKLLRDILRDEMGFSGVVISDYAAVSETITHSISEDKRDAAKKAITAGCDIDMMSDCYIGCLEALVNDGEIDESLIDEAVMRVLELKNALGLFENPYRDGSAEKEKAVLFCREHRELSRRAAEECIVMLKNDGALPLDSRKKIAVIGSLADNSGMTGSWALFVDRNETVTLKKAIGELYPHADVSFFISDEADEDMLHAAAAADVVVMALGEDQTTSGEALSKADISLPAAQRKLFDAVYGVNTNIVTVLFGGRPLAVPDTAARSNALIEAWLPGSLGCYALADILFGKVNPSGKLSMSMPYCTGQLPISYSTFSTGRPKPEGAEGFCPFISNYLDAPNVPLYPFGYGISYSELEYSPVMLDNDTLTPDGKITASVTIRNKSGMDAREAVQLYIRDIKGSVVRPMRELKSVQKLLIPAGNEITAEFIITEDMLRFYNIDMDFTSEPGDFMLWIGGSSLTDNGAGFRLVK
ncbi:MAG: glycoside hydrolase family 3 N-terminal domain-containing protein [Huintestinicola sp.]